MLLFVLWVTVTLHLPATFNNTTNIYVRNDMTETLNSTIHGIEILYRQPQSWEPLTRYWRHRDWSCDQAILILHAVQQPPCQPKCWLYWWPFLSEFFTLNPSKSINSAVCHKGITPIILRIVPVFYRNLSSIAPSHISNHCCWIFFSVLQNW